MSESEKPLHVRVAEALGCKVEQPKYGNNWHCGCKETKAGERPHSAHAIRDDCHDGEGLGCEPYDLASFDTDWSATGPLIEKYQIMITPGVPGFSSWEAYVKVDVRSDGTNGGTPLEAVCNLILALAEAGKLEAA